MTNLKALLKFTHENITSSRWDMDAEDYSEFMYLHEKAMGELGRLEEYFDEHKGCPPGYDSTPCSGRCEECWQSYVISGGE